MATYRVNYGNGQVNGPFSSRKAALDYMKVQREYDRRYGDSSAGMFLQRYEGDGEWSTVNLKSDSLAPESR